MNKNWRLNFGKKISFHESFEEAFVEMLNQCAVQSVPTEVLLPTIEILQRNGPSLDFFDIKDEMESRKLIVNGKLIEPLRKYINIPQKPVQRELKLQAA